MWAGLKGDLQGGWSLVRMRDDRAGEGEGARQCWEEVLTREGIDYVEKREAE